MPKNQLLVENAKFPLPDSPDADWINRLLVDCMEKGVVSEIMVGEEGEPLTRLIFNGRAVGFAAVQELADA